MYPASDWRDERDGDLRPDAQAEYARDLKWIRFECECVDFAKSEPDGWAAVLRAVARAMHGQRELPL